MSRLLTLALSFLCVAVFLAKCEPAPQTQVTVAQLTDSEFISRKIRCVLDEAPCDALGQKLKGMCIIILPLCLISSIPFS
jgi:hypothetical protein